MMYNILFFSFLVNTYDLLLVIMFDRILVFDVFCIILYLMRGSRLSVVLLFTCVHGYIVTTYLAEYTFIDDG